MELSFFYFGHLIIQLTSSRALRLFLPSEMPNRSGKSAAGFIGKAARFFTINPLVVGFYAN